uniref:Uncharacterized protein n=1 Tax=Lutzomyia longipalpis TaxID=7200 RepID=A0A1B0CM71_LUTLO
MLRDRKGHVQNCISQAVAGANTTITFTIRHSGNVTKIEKVLKGGTFHMDFLKIESPTREVLVTIATRDGNLTRIHLAGVNKATPSVTIHQILSLSTITSTSPNTTINVMEYTKHVYLIVGTPKSTLNGSILVYKLAKGTPKFQHRQTIEGNYFTIRCNDALGMIIVGNRGSNFVSIYRVDDESEDFKLFQSIKLQSTLGMLSTFALAENQFFVIALQNDNIHIYKYNYIEGWVLICVNQYPNIESLTPFTLDGEGYLLAITSTNATAIALFSQTEH